jgi:hypothetical protein
MEQTIITAILNQLAAEHGNNWPEHALEMYLNLEITTRYGFGPVNHAHRLALRDWVLENIKCGIVYRQLFLTTPAKPLPNGNEG